MTTSYSMVTRYLGDYIDLKRVQENIKTYHYLNRDHPLVLRLLEDQYAVLTKFGTVSFWNVKKNLVNQFIDELVPYIKNYNENYPFVDTLKININPKQEESMSFEEVFLNDIDVDKIKIISYVSAQSVAIDRYEEEITVLLKEIWQVIDNLRRKGKTLFSEKYILKKIGQVLAIKQNTIANVALFDEPEETWEREEIEALYKHLAAEYDLRERFNVLNKKIDFLTENNSILMNFISTQKNNFLELIITVLIIVELVIYVLEWLKIYP